MDKENYSNTKFAINKLEFKYASMKLALVDSEGYAKEKINIVQDFLLKVFVKRHNVFGAGL